MCSVHDDEPPCRVANLPSLGPARAYSFSDYLQLQAKDELQKKSNEIRLVRVTFLVRKNQRVLGSFTLTAHFLLFGGI